MNSPHLLVIVRAQQSDLYMKNIYVYKIENIYTYSIHKVC